MTDFAIYFFNEESVELKEFLEKKWAKFYEEKDWTKVYTEENWSKIFKYHQDRVMILLSDR